MHLRTFCFAVLLCAIGSPLTIAQQPSVPAPSVDAGVQAFLTDFVTALNTHDPVAFLRLQAEDCATVNRAGRFFRDRKSLTPFMGKLIKEGFKDFQFPPLRPLLQRSLAPNLVIVQAAWQNPSLEPPPAPSLSDMVVTFVLRRSGNVWLAEEVDSHDVEPLPVEPGQTVTKP